MSAASRPFLLAGVGFAAGLLVGALAFAGIVRSKGADAVSESNSAGNARVGDPAASAGSSKSGASMDTPPPTLAMPPAADEDALIRRLVADAARAKLGGELPRDYLDEAVLRIQRYEASLPRTLGVELAGREKIRRRIGELPPSWEVVIQLRSASTVSADLQEYEHGGRRVDASKSPLDVTLPIETRDERYRVYVHSGVAPIGQAAILESIDVRGQFGTPWETYGRVDLNFDGRARQELRGKGATHVRFEGSLRAPWFTGFGSNDATVSAESAAVEVVFRGRWSPRDAGPEIKDRPFRAVVTESPGYLGTGQIRLQVLNTGHGGGFLFLDGTRKSASERASDHSIWDDSIEWKKLREPAAFSSGTGLVPPGKALRVRRIDWRVRFGNFGSSSRLVMKVNGRDEISIKGEDVGTREEQRARAIADTVVEEFRTGTWTGEVLIRPGEEMETSLQCEPAALGEAVFDGELIDESK